MQTEYGKSNKVNELAEEIMEETDKMSEAPVNLDSNLLNERMKKRKFLLDRLFREDVDRQWLINFLQGVREKDAITVARLNMRYDEVKKQLVEINENRKINTAYK